MIRLGTCVAVLIFLHLIAAGQSNSFKLTKEIPTDAADVAVDNTGNIYLISHDNQLKKLDANGDSVSVYNSVTRFGDISFIDVTNPLKILIYYRDFATIVEVDRFLNILNTIDLRSLGIFQVRAIGLGYDNNIWLFDELEARLKRIHDDGSIVDQTADFRQIFDSIPDPSLIADQGDFVFLYDSAKGIYVFDHYGAVKSHVQAKNWRDVTVIEKNVIGRNDHSFLKYEVGKLDIQQEPIAPTLLPATKIIVTSTSMYVLKRNRLEVYSK